VRARLLSPTVAAAFVFTHRAAASVASGVDSRALELHSREEELNWPAPETASALVELRRNSRGEVGARRRIPHRALLLRGGDKAEGLRFGLTRFSSPHEQGREEVGRPDTMASNRAPSPHQEDWERRPSVRR
jgi:hypothetical protein